jgi:hypothetical protein
MVCSTHRTPWLSLGVALLGLATFAGSGGWAAAPPEPPEPSQRPVGSGRLPVGELVVPPERDEPEYWAGAPSVVRDADGVFWLAYRARSPEAPRGERGHSLVLLRSDDGLQFQEVHRIARHQIPVPGFERPALLIDPQTGHFKLYGCGAWQGGPWSIFKLDDALHPSDFDPATARPVIMPIPTTRPRQILPEEYKDPVIVHDGRQFHAFVIGYLRRNERIYHFVSDDGERWNPSGPPHASLLPLEAWHDFFVRPAAVVPSPPGWLFFYEGSHTGWDDPVYNIATGLAFSFDLHRLVNLTPDRPLWTSPTPSERFDTFRYASVVPVADALWVYAEVVRPSGAHDIRRFIIPARFTATMTTKK